MKLERITEQQIRDAIAKLQPDKFQYDYESVANCQRDADQKVVDELEHKLNMSKIEVKGLELTVKALEAKLPLLLTPDEASFLTVCFDISSGDQYGKIALDAPIRAKLRAIVEGA